MAFLDGMVCKCDRFTFHPRAMRNRLISSEELGRCSDEAADGEQSQVIQECGVIGEGAHVVEAGGD